MLVVLSLIKEGARSVWPWEGEQRKPESGFSRQHLVCLFPLWILLCPLTVINLSHYMLSLLVHVGGHRISKNKRKQNKTILRGIQCDSNFINLITRGTEELICRQGHSVGERAGTYILPVSLQRSCSFRCVRQPHLIIHILGQRKLSKAQ